MFQDSTAGASIAVRVTPRAGRTALAGADDGVLRIRLAAPPVEGAANAALVRFIADVLDVPRTTVHIAAGERGRSKRVLITGHSAADLNARLRPLLEPGSPR